MSDITPITPTPPDNEGPVSYPPEAVLTAEQVAAWLRISKRSVLRLPISRVEITPQRFRYLASDVYAYLRSRRAA